MYRRTKKTKKPDGIEIKKFYWLREIIYIYYAFTMNKEEERIGHVKEHFRKAI